MGARETAANETSLARRWASVPLKLSAQNEQCGHLSFYSVGNMKW